MIEAPHRIYKCKGCGENHDLPWGYCLTCTAVLLDMSREPQYRLNPQDVLDTHVEKMKAHAEDSNDSVE